MCEARLPFNWYQHGMDLVVKTPRMKREHLIKHCNIVVDRSTGHGEDADYYERKPYNGRKLIDMRYAKAVPAPLESYYHNVDNSPDEVQEILHG